MGNASVQRGLFLTFRLFSLIRHALRRATFPVGEGDLPAGVNTLSWERVAGRSPDGCGAVPSLQQGDPSVSLGLTAPFTQGSLPLFRRCGGTFPQGKVRKPAGLRFYGLPPVLVLAGIQAGEFFEGP